MKSSESVFRRILKFFQFNKVKDSSDSSEDYPAALESKYSVAWERMKSLGVEPGDCLLFGPSALKSIAGMVRVLAREGLESVRVFAFDSPAKQSPHAEQIDWSRTFLIEGQFIEMLNSGTSEKYLIKKASIIMVDADDVTTKSVLEYSAGLIKDHAVIFFNDWRNGKKIYSEFLKVYSHIKSVELGVYNPDGRIFFVTNIDCMGVEVSLGKSELIRAIDENEKTIEDLRKMLWLLEKHLNESPEARAGYNNLKRELDHSCLNRQRLKLALTLVELEKE